MSKTDWDQPPVGELPDLHGTEGRAIRDRDAEIAKLDISKGLDIFRLNDGELVRDLLGKTINRGIPLKDLKRRWRRPGICHGWRRADSAEGLAVRPSQWSVITQAIQAIQLTTGSESEAQAIELMAAEYLSGLGVSRAA